LINIIAALSGDKLTNINCQGHLLRTAGIM